MHPPDRAARGVGTGEPWALPQPGVGITGQVVFRFPGGRNGLHRACKVPGHESLPRIVAEDLAPGAGFADRFGKHFGDWGRECRIGGLTVITVGAQQADLILDLHHDDGILFSVNLADEAHQGSKCLAVLLHGFGAQGRDGVEFFTRHLFSPEIGFRVLFHPGRHIHRLGVLPQAEPQETEFQILPSGRADHRLHKGKVIAAFRRLNQFPVHRSDHRVHVQPAQRWPEFILQIGRVGGAGIVDFAASHEERLIVDIKGGEAFLIALDNRNAHGFCSFRFSSLWGLIFCFHCILTRSPGQSYNINKHIK